MSSISINHKFGIILISRQLILRIINHQIVHHYKGDLMYGKKSEVMN